MDNSSVVISDEDNLNPLFEDMDEQESFLDHMREVEFVSCGSKPPKVLSSKPPTTKETDDVQLLIRSFQEDNPQIETVFIESDEEDKQLDIRETPSFKTPPQTPVKNTEVRDVPPLRSYARVKTPHLEPLVKITTSNGKYSPPKLGSPLTIRQIIPEETSKGLLKNSRIIALDENNFGTSGTKKFLLIPNEVAPVLAKSQGPITFNVPGLGPVVISDPSDLMKAKKAFQLLDPQIPQPKPVKVPPPYDPFGDPKYSCWKYIKNRKRDIEGFSINDRLGFNATEATRAKACALKLGKFIEQLEKQLAPVMGASKKEKFVPQAKIKIVNIEKLKNKPKRHKFLSKKKKIPPSPPLLLSSPQHSEPENDLLVTKKVVMLNQNGQKLRGRKRKLTSKPQVEVKRQKIIQLPKKGRPRKQQQLQDIVKPCSVRLKNDKTVEEALEKYYGIPGILEKLQKTCRIIDNLKQLKAQIDPLKPLIILDEENYSEINFQKVANQFNIVFSLGEKKNFTNVSICKKEFVNSIKTYNIKFVKSRILCDYLFSKDRKF